MRILGGVTPRVFLLSPASCTGLRAKLLLREEARFELAARLREGGALLDELLACRAGIDFRGQL